MNIAKALLDFHTAYNVPVHDCPGLPARERRALRINLITEEYQELLDAERENNIVEIADALGDIIYIAFGTALEYGINLNEVIAEIHRVNMSKLDDNGMPVFRSDGKVLKGERYTPPDIRKVLFGKGV